jgi:hypothetical protein
MALTTSFEIGLVRGIEKCVDAESTYALLITVDAVGESLEGGERSIRRISPQRPGKS